MNWQAILTSMLPEHLLLAGIVLLILVDLVSDRSRGALAIAVAAVAAVSGVVLGAMYMLWLAQRMLFGSTKAPHLPITDLNRRESAILAILVVAVFWLGLFPQEAMRKTEVAAREYQTMVAGKARPTAVGAVTPAAAGHAGSAR
jgi:NADH:ubiquinone oxidoreductase subunit 4 (subunit M)